MASGGWQTDAPRAPPARGQQREHPELAASEERQTAAPMAQYREQLAREASVGRQTAAAWTWRQTQRYSL